MATNEPLTGLAALEKQRKDFNDKSTTRYVFTPFLDIGVDQIPGKNIAAGKIVAIGALERTALEYELGDEGKAAILRRTGPNNSVVVYLDSPGPVVAWQREVHAHEGFAEIPALKGIPESEFEASRFNDLLFGKLPRTINGQFTAATLREGMNNVIAKSANVKGGEMLASIAKTILQSTEICDQMCHAEMNKRHAEIKDVTNSDKPKRYSLRDRRMLEFGGIKPIEEQMQEVVANQTTAISAIPEILSQMREDKKQQNEMFSHMINAFKTLADDRTEGKASQKKAAEVANV